MNTPEELLRQAFELGQQWVQDMNNDKQPTNFNEWYASNEVQQQVKKCDLADVVGSEERAELVCGFCGTNKAEVCFKCHTNECVSAAGQN